MVDDWEPPLPEGWSIDDVVAGLPVDDGDARLLLSGPEAELIADIWSADARAARERANLYRAVDGLARCRPVSRDLPAGAPGAAGTDSRALRAPRLEGVSEAFVPELALIRGCSEQEAETVALEAVAVVRHLPGVLTEMETGRCSVRKAQALVDLLSPVSREVAARIEAEVLPDVEARTVPQLRARVRRLLAKWDAEALEERRAQARRRVDVTHRAVGDGMSELAIGLPTPTAAACAEACDRYAQLLRDGGDTRPIGVLRAEVAADLILRPWDTSRPAVTAHVVVHAPLGSVADSAPAPAPAPSSGPAEVAGHVVTAAQCAELLAQLDAAGLRAPAGGSLQVAVEDRGRLVAVANRRELERGAFGRRVRRGTTPGGSAADPGGPGLRPPPPTSGYRPTVEQRRFVQVRDRTCRMPGCRRRAERCDVDHDVPFGQGGVTDVCNLVCLCRRHHRVKTHQPGWAFHLLPDGRLRVTTPSGVVRTSAPPGYVTRREPDPPWLDEMAPPDPLDQS